MRALNCRSTAAGPVSCSALTTAAPVLACWRDYVQVLLLSHGTVVLLLLGTHAMVVMYGHGCLLLWLCVAFSLALLLAT